MLLWVSSSELFLPESCGGPLLFFLFLILLVLFGTPGFVLISVLLDSVPSKVFFPLDSVCPGWKLASLLSIDSSSVYTLSILRSCSSSLSLVPNSNLSSARIGSGGRVTAGSGMLWVMGGWSDRPSAAFTVIQWSNSFSIKSLILHLSVLPRFLFSWVSATNSNCAINVSCCRRTSWVLGEMSVCPLEVVLARRRDSWMSGRIVVSLVAMYLMFLFVFLMLAYSLSSLILCSNSQVASGNSSASGVRRPHVDCSGDDGVSSRSVSDFFLRIPSSTPRMHRSSSDMGGKGGGFATTGVGGWLSVVHMVSVGRSGSSTVCVDCSLVVVRLGSWVFGVVVSSSFSSSISSESRSSSSALALAVRLSGTMWLTKDSQPQVIVGDKMR